MAARVIPGAIEKERWGVTDDGPYVPSLEPTTQNFLDELERVGALPLSRRTAGEVRTALAALQSGPVGRPNATLEDMTFPVGPMGAVPVRIVRPTSAVGPIPVVMFFHGGGWVAGDVDTHDRLVREIAVAVHAAVVFVRFARAPESQFPIAVEEAYAATAFVVNNAGSLSLDGRRLAVVGDGAGGNMAAAVTILSNRQPSTSRSGHLESGPQRLG
jgi:acetyl esterase